MTDENDAHDNPPSKSNVVPFRKSHPLKPASHGVSLTFGLDVLHGEFIIRYPDGSIERLGISLDDFDQDGEKEN